MQNLLPRFDTLPEKPPLRGDNWSVQESVPQKVVRKLRAPKNTVASRPRAAPDERWHGPKLPQRKRFSVEQRMAQFERSIYGPGASADRPPLIPPELAADGTDGSSVFLTQEAGAGAATSLPAGWEPGASSQFTGPAPTIHARQLAPRPSRPVSQPSERPSTRASSRGDMRGPSRGEHSEAISVEFTNHAPDREADVFFTSGKKLASFSVEPGHAAKRRTQGSAPAEPVPGPEEGVSLELAPLQMRAVEERCSITDIDEVTLQFCNHNTTGAIEVSWLDYDGQPVLRRSLPPGESYMERSFASHPWLVRDASKKHSLLVTFGARAAQAKSRFSAVWNASEHRISFMSSSAADAGSVKRSLIAAQPQLASGRLAQGRALLVQQMRELRRDPVTNTSADFSLVVLPSLPPTNVCVPQVRSLELTHSSSRQGGMLNDADADV